jgi:acyl carrier protein
MALDRNEVRDCVIQCICEISNDKDPTAIDEQTDPMLTLGLDSHEGVNLACKLSEKLNYDIPNRINPLFDDEHHRPRRVGEITDLICKLLATTKEETHG